MASPILDLLPPELQDHVVSLIKRPSDLKSLCLSCKQFRSIATPYLYRFAVIDPLAVAAKSGFLAVGNPGHPHIEHLRLKPLENSDKLEQHVSANKTVRLALNCLAKDSLRSLRLPMKLLMEPETLAAILTLQRNLREVCVGRVRDAASQISFLVKPKLEHLRSIIIPPLGNEHDLEFYHDIMALSHSNIEHLSLSGADTWHSTSGHLLELNNTATHDGLLFATIFHTQHGTINAEPLKLSKLRSFRANKLQLGNDAGRWSRIFAFEQLSVIIIEKCTHLELFLYWLGERFKVHGSQLKEFGCAGHKIVCKALEKVLSSFTGLETFEIAETSYGLTQGMNFASLATHYATLKRLKLKYASSDVRAFERPALDAFDIVEMVTCCQNLEQLFLDFLDTTITTLQGQEWGVYGKWIARFHSETSEAEGLAHRLMANGALSRFYHTSAHVRVGIP
ncbi:hypothetical protein CB0940_03334 [Cercospora beticola]|uniref:Uncharacterized protein n=1 Tax=Cercospora beticola TaxID=122368 RepID=A0A2G5I1M2_CERBT|nr:hypothetical protein CB0940_03334 [Cercospora beticola]PIA98651.1 hypothetical protein CB0940_03334 [Cercospora beticola]WPB00509.1 hypothetical protein RHO25_005129 [Cercospora beticola]